MAEIDQQPVGRMTKQPTRIVEGVRWFLSSGAESLLSANELRLSDYIKNGWATIIKHGDHRTVYRVPLSFGDVYWKHCRLNGPRPYFRDLFRGPKAKLEFDRLRELAARGIATVEPLAWGKFDYRWPRGSFIITQALERTIPLDEFLSNHPPQSPMARRALTKSLGSYVALLHQAGVQHPDFHPGNVLVRDEDGELKFYLIDVHDIEIGPPLSDRARRENLILWGRWFRPRVSRADRLRFWRAYAGAGADPEGARKLETLGDRSIIELFLSRDARSTRENRHFRQLRGKDIGGFGVRELDPAIEAKLLADPDGPFQSQSKIIKDSRSSTVCIWPAPSASFEVTLGQPGGARSFSEGDAEQVAERSCTSETSSRIVSASPSLTLQAPPVDTSATPKSASGPRAMIYKRFCVTKWYDPIANLLRPSPAMRSWRNGHAFLDRLIPTARPWLVLHRRRFGMPSVGYVLFDRLENGTQLQEVVPQLDREGVRKLTVRLAGWIRTMHERGVSHRDLKAPNILVMPDGECCFLDLVGVELGRSVSRRARVRDIMRLNASFLDTPAITLSDRLRFLRAYLQWNLHGKEGWERWWKEIAGATRAKIKRNSQRNRPLA